MYLIGHPAYPQNRGNRCATANSPHLACMILIERGATPKDARKAVEAATQGHLGTCYVEYGDVCEIKTQKP
jgi:hypothetical protein